MKIMSRLVIPNARVLEGEIFQDRLEATMDELTSNDKGFLFPLGVYGELTTKVAEVPPSEPEQVLGEREFDHYFVLEFRSELETSSWKYKNTDSSERSESIHRALIAKFYEHRIKLLMTIANLAKVGSMEANSTTTKIDQQVFTTRRSISASHLRMVCLEDEVPSWPPIDNLGLVEAWDWALQEHGFMKGFGGTKVSRALNAFTFLLEPLQELSASLLMWAMVGIEALFGAGNGGLMDQISGKSISLHGAKEGITKLLSSMYDFRSRFVHGDLEFTASDPFHDEGPRQGKHEAQLHEAQQLSSLLLISTLQRLIVEKSHQLEFRYTPVLR